MCWPGPISWLYSIKSTSRPLSKTTEFLSSYFKILLGGTINPMLHTITCHPDFMLTLGSKIRIRGVCLGSAHGLWGILTRNWERCSNWAIYTPRRYHVSRDDSIQSKVEFADHENSFRNRSLMVRIASHFSPMSSQAHISQVSAPPCSTLSPTDNLLPSSMAGFSSPSSHFVSLLRLPRFVLCIQQLVVFTIGRPC